MTATFFFKSLVLIICSTCFVRPGFWKNVCRKLTGKQQGIVPNAKTDEECTSKLNRLVITNFIAITLVILLLGIKLCVDPNLNWRSFLFPIYVVMYIQSIFTKYYTFKDSGKTYQVTKKVFLCAYIICLIAYVYGTYTRYQPEILEYKPNIIAFSGKEMALKTEARWSSNVQYWYDNSSVYLLGNSQDEKYFVVQKEESLVVFNTDFKGCDIFEYLNQQYPEKGFSLVEVIWNEDANQTVYGKIAILETPLFGRPKVVKNVFLDFKKGTLEDVIPPIISGFTIVQRERSHSV